MEPQNADAMTMSGESLGLRCPPRFMTAGVTSCNHEAFEGAILELRLPDIQCFRLQSGATPIGRGVDNSIQVNDPSVSSRHCEIVLGPDGAVIRDLGSTNGTFVAGHRVPIASLNYEKPFRLANVECVLHRMQSPAALAPDRAGSKRNRVKIDREAWRPLAIGLGLAVIICVVPLLAYIVDFLRVIIHEGGHALTAWLFGYPAIPMLRPGGGVSVSMARPTWMILLLLAALAYLLYHVYRDRWHIVAVSLAASAYLVCLFTHARLTLITIMGHGAELLVASVFLYRALSGRSIIVRSERPLYAALALVIFGLDIRFALKLLLQPDAEADYREGVDGGSHDLVRIAEEYLHLELRSVVLVFLILCLLAPVGVFFYHTWNRTRNPATRTRLRPAPLAEFVR